MQARPADAEGECRAQPLVVGNANASRPKAQTGDVSALSPTGRTAAAGGEKEETWAFLIRVTEETTMRIGAMPVLELIHAPTLRRVMGACLNIPGNYN